MMALSVTIHVLRLCLTRFSLFFRKLVFLCSSELLVPRTAVTLREQVFRTCVSIGFGTYNPPLLIEEVIEVSDLF